MKLEEITGWALRVFDFDDTLVKTDALVYVNNNGKRTSLTPGEFAKYKPKKGDEFDFHEFDQLINPREIKPMLKVLKHLIAAASVGKSRVMILTARSTPKPVDDWLTKMGLKVIPVKALGKGDPNAKAKYIEKQILNGAVDIEFFDDSSDNVDAVNKLKKKYPDVKIRTRVVRY